VLRLKGNRFFKAKKYAEAIEKYMASLKVQPYTVNTLTNIAISYHKKSAFEDALEFANRAVYLEPANIKVCVNFCV
jgi:tetratricopeptide (TPR) repeat protein